jgi:hypothetical protein
MSGLNTTDKVLWIADCYSLAKRFPDPLTWLALLQPRLKQQGKEINPLYYWLWMEIWNAAQSAKPLTIK